MRIFSVYILIFILHTYAPAVEVSIISWPSKNTAPVAIPPKGKQLQFSLLRTTLKFPIKESFFIKGSTLANHFFHLEKQQAKLLSDKLNTYYKQIDQDPTFKNLPSSLSYCFSSKKHTQGEALLYTPKQVNKHTPFIVFLHGYAGNFIYYTHILAKMFPNAVILSPSYGISCANISQNYITEAVVKVKKLHPQLKQIPTLIGLSAGARGALNIYSENTASYKACLAIASYPHNQHLKLAKANGKYRLIAGQKEPFVTNFKFVTNAKKLKAIANDTKAAIVKDAGHFFLLTQHDKTSKILQKWAQEDGWYKRN